MGAGAFALGDPSGGTLLALPLAGLAAIGVTLSVSCGDKAKAKSEKAVLKALKDHPELSDKELSRAKALLEKLPSAAHFNPKNLASTTAKRPLRDVLSEEILASLAIAEDDTMLRTIMSLVVQAGVDAVMSDPEFRSSLTLEIVLETARKQNIHIETSQDTNMRVRQLQDTLENLTTAPRDQLELLASRFEIETPHALSDGKLQQLLAQKAEEYRSYRDQIDALDDRIAGVHNLKAAAQDAAERLDFDEVEELLARVDMVETEIMAETKEARATNALLRGRVDQAYTIFTAAAESFRGLDILTMARSRDRYRKQLYRHGDRYGSTGLARAIDMQRPAIDALSETEHRKDWAGFTQNLANALSQLGTRTEGAAGTKLLAEAVSAYREAITVFKSDNQSEDWALTTQNLAIALRNQGSRTEGEAGTVLLAEAVTAFRDALTIRTRKDHPVEWAMSKQNLANALLEQGKRTEGMEGTKLLEAAVRSYRQALTIYDRDKNPVAWAITTQNLAVALRVQGSRTEGEKGTALLAEVVTVYREALTVRTREDHPIDWAMTTQNLAGALQEQGRRTDGKAGTALLKEAVTTYREAQNIFTREDHPVQWAMAIRGIAMAELALSDHLATSDPALHLSAAIKLVKDALTVFDPKHTSFEYAQCILLRERIREKLDALKDS